MNSSFNILTPGYNTTQCQLTVFINSQEISYIVLNANNVCVALAVYPFKAGATNPQVADYLKDIVADQYILKEVYKKINIIYSFSESVLIPHQFLNVTVNKELLEMVYGDIASCTTKTDFIIKNNLHNVYSIPNNIINTIGELFPKANHCHLYSLLQNITQTDENQLYCIINSTHLIVQLVKEGKLQMVQTFEYKTPDDITYYLLNMCKSFDVLPQKTPILLNGFITADNLVMVELQRYFTIEYGSLPKSLIINDEIQKYPLHYFNHLFELSACV